MRRPRLFPALPAASMNCCDNFRRFRTSWNFWEDAQIGWRSWQSNRSASASPWLRALSNSSWSPPKRVGPSAWTRLPIPKTWSWWRLRTSLTSSGRPSETSGWSLLFCQSPNAAISSGRHSSSCASVGAMQRQECVVISSGLSNKTAISLCMVSWTSKMVHGRPSSEKHSPATRCRAGAKVRWASKTAKSNPSRACLCLPLGHLQWRKAAVRRRGSDRAVCAYLKQPNAMTQGARRTVHLSSPTACSSTMRSSNACTMEAPPPVLGHAAQLPWVWLALADCSGPAPGSRSCSSTSRPGVLCLVPEYGSSTGPSPPYLEERVAPDSPGRLSAPARCSPLGRWWPSQLLEPSSRQPFGRSVSIRPWERLWGCRQACRSPYQWAWTRGHWPSSERPRWCSCPRWWPWASFCRSSCEQGGESLNP